MAMNVLLGFIYVQCICAWYLQKPEEGIRSPRAGVTGGGEPPMWVPGVKGKSSEPSLQSLDDICLCASM